MAEGDETTVYKTLSDFYTETSSVPRTKVSRIVHCLNPFPAKAGSEHDRAQRVTFATMTQAREITGQLCPNLSVEFAKITDEQDVSSDLIRFDHHHKTHRSMSDLGTFKIVRPLPIMMDLLTAHPLDPDDVLVFTNVDIALTPGFYAFIESILSRDTDCAIINRRTVSNAYLGEADTALMACEIGAPHPGFDCFAMRGRLRDTLLAYNSCVGIGKVMLPLVHQLLALAERPVILTDAHATYHLGDDQQWQSSDFDDYQRHNQSEVSRVFQALLDTPRTRETLLSRLSVLTGGHRNTLFDKELRAQAGWPQDAFETKTRKKSQRARAALRRLLGKSAR